jgi:acyl-[acyl carrier protein]--UDP-N-acetylglucosamine O-acyltransferase
MIVAAVHDVVNDNAVIGGSSGWGIWLTVAASAVLAGCAAVAAVRRVRPTSAVD